MENCCIYNIANIFYLLETFILLKCLARQFQPKTSDKKYRRYCSFHCKIFSELFKNSSCSPRALLILLPVTCS